LRPWSSSIAASIHSMLMAQNGCIKAIINLLHRQYGGVLANPPPMALSDYDSDREFDVVDGYR
jgi:hypothetical protein